MIRSKEKGGKLVTTDKSGKLSYTNIPNYILMLLFTMRLTRPEWKLYLYLRKNKNSHSATAWPPVRTIVRDAHITINSVKPARDRLIELGLISANSIPGIGIEITFNDEAMLELAKKIDLENLEVLPTESNGSDQDHAPETSENEAETDEVLLTESNGGVTDSEEQGVTHSGETITTNTTTISITTTEGGEELSKENGNDLTTSSPSLSPVETIADANINIKGGVTHSEEHLPVDDEDEEEEISEVNIVEQRRERLGARFADIPLYSPEQEDRPYLEQFLLLYNTNAEARQATLAAMSEWDRLHRQPEMMTQGARVSV
jgi:hypothetical protein